MVTQPRATNPRVLLAIVYFAFCSALSKYGYRLERELDHARRR